MPSPTGELRSTGVPGAFGQLAEWAFQPWTNLQGWFSPQVTVGFGRNAGDRAVEESVLAGVGSYGFQLNRLLDAVRVLTSRLDRQSLTPTEQLAIVQFEEVAREADRVARVAQGKPPRELTLDDVHTWIDQLLDLKRENPALFAAVAEKLSASLHSPAAAD